jgi:hypothetical protein
MKFDDEVAKQLNAVVGESYSPPRSWRATILKWVGAAILAVAASVGIITILNTHVMKAQTDAAAKRPVQIQLLPPAPPPSAKEEGARK